MSDSDSVNTAWLVAVIRVPSEPSRHRVALWRDLRRLGAVSLGPTVWALPDSSTSRGALERVCANALRAQGSAISLSAAGLNPSDVTSLERAFVATRAAEWDELISECGKFLAEIAHEHAISKYTLAELDEEEHSLDQLRRWASDITDRDPEGIAVSQAGADALARCEAALAEYAEHVYKLNNPSGEQEPLP